MESYTLKEESPVIKVIINIFLVIWAIINLFPIYFMFTFSLKSNEEIFGENIIGLPKHWLWSNYSSALNTGNMALYFFNSLLVTTIAIAISIMAAMMACSKIDGNERMELVSTQVVPNEPEEEVELPDSLYDAPIKVVERRVLIEDHTGQKCPNCPDGAQIIRDLQRTYGARIVPIAIHSQMQGIMEPEGLGNELGNTYYKAWNLEFKPAGLINRISDGNSTVLDKTIWAMAVQFIMNNEIPTCRSLYYP